MLPENLAYDEWRALGAKLREVHAATPWMIGDWLAYGISNYSKTLWGGQVPHGLAKELAESLGLAPSTVWSYTAACKALEPSRRREGVTMQHTLEVLKRVKAPKEQDAWFTRILSESLPVKSVREQLRREGADVKSEKADRGTSSVLESARQFVRDFNALDEVPEALRDELLRILSPVVNQLT